MNTNSHSNSRTYAGDTILQAVELVQIRVRWARTGVVAGVPLVEVQREARWQSIIRLYFRGEEAVIWYRNYYPGRGD